MFIKLTVLIVKELSKLNFKLIYIIKALIQKQKLRILLN